MTGRVEKNVIVAKFDELQSLLIEIENNSDLLEHLSNDGKTQLSGLREELFCLVNSDLKEHEYSDEWFLKQDEWIILSREIG